MRTVKVSDLLWNLRRHVSARARLVKLACLGIPLAVLAPSLAVASEPPGPAVFSALATIRRDAAALATAHQQQTAWAQARSREILVEWARIAPRLSTDGDVLVETNRTNRSIALFAQDVEMRKDLRDEAREISANVGDLIAAAKT